MDFFGTPWGDLTLADVEAFLAGQEDEGLTWETKGTEIRPASVLKAVCGFANQMGGFLILGATREPGEGWTLDGLSYADEPSVWLSNVISSGLDPRPTFDVKVWPVDGNRHVAVVRVEPVAVPPCVTSSGQIYQRLPGKTELVSDASILASLFERGQGAKDEAEAIAMRAVRRDFNPEQHPHLLIHVAVGPTGKAEDVARVLFSRAFDDEVATSYERLPGEPLLLHRSRGDFVIRHTQTDVIADPTGDDRQRWRIRCRWDGSVLVSLTVYPEGDDEARLSASAVFADAVRPAANEALGLARALGAFGPAHVVLTFETGGFGLFARGEIGARPFPSMTTQAWVDEPPLPDATIDRWLREFLRSAGFTVHEPDDD